MIKRQLLAAGLRWLFNNELEKILVVTGELSDVGR
jgi:hypothetical protein